MRVINRPLFSFFHSLYLLTFISNLPNKFLVIFSVSQIENKRVRTSVIWEEHFSLDEEKLHNYATRSVVSPIQNH